MIHKWTKILPFFIVEYIAKKYGERHATGRNKVFVYPYDGVKLFVDSEKEGEE